MDESINQSVYVICIGTNKKDQFAHHSCGIYNISGKVNFSESDNLMMCILNSGVIAMKQYNGRQV